MRKKYTFFSAILIFCYGFFSVIAGYGQIDSVKWALTTDGSFVEFGPGVANITPTNQIFSSGLNGTNSYSSVNGAKSNNYNSASCSTLVSSNDFLGFSISTVGCNSYSITQVDFTHISGPNATVDCIQLFDSISGGARTNRGSVVNSTNVSNGFTVSGAGLGFPILVAPGKTITFFVIAKTNGVSANDTVVIKNFVVRGTVGAVPIPQGSLTGNTICAGGTGQLTWTSSAGTGPFTVVYSNGTSNVSQTNVTSGVAFNASPNPGSTNNYTVVSVTDANGCVRNSGFTGGSATITVRPLPQGSLSGNTICNGATGQLTWTSSAGTGPFTVVYSNGTSNVSQSNVTSGVAFNASPNPGSTNNYTVVSVTDANGCIRNSGFTGASATITVRPLPQGTFSGNTICNGSQGQLTWSSTSGTGPFTVVYSNGTSNVSQSAVNSGVAFNASPNPTSTTNYTLVSVTDANGCVRNSGFTGGGTATINVVARPTGAISSPNVTICSGGSTNITGTITATGNWTVTIQNSSGTTTTQSGSGTTFSISVSPSATTTFTISALVAGTCSAQAGDLSGSTTVTVNAVASGNVGSDQTICSGGNPAAFTQSSNSTGSGSLTFQWQSTITSCTVGFSNITGETATSLNVPAGLANTTFYRLVTTSTLNGVACTSNSSCITVSVNDVDGGTVAPSVQTICSGGLPTIFTSTVNPSGSGPITRQWQKNTTSCVSTFTDISGATGNTFTETVPLTTTTFYRRKTTSTLNGIPCEEVSNCITVFVNDVDAGQTGTSHEICFGGDPLPFTSIVDGSGAGGITSQWESSTTSCVAGFTPIAGATSSTFDAPVGLTTTTFFRRITTSTLNGVQCSDTGNCITVTVNDLPDPVIIGDSIICQNTTTQLCAIDQAGHVITNFVWTPSGSTACINPTLPAGDSNFSVTITDNKGCTNSVTESVHAILTPVADAVSDFTRCNGEIVTAMVFSGTNSENVKYYWQNDNTSIGIPSNGVDSISEFTAQNLGSVPVVSTITVTPYNFFPAGSTVDSCDGTPIIFSVTVNPIPNLISPKFVTICSDDNLNYDIKTNFVNGVVYSWTSAVTGVCGSLVTGNTSQAPGTNHVISDVLVNSSVNTPCEVIYSITVHFINNGDTCRATSTVTVTLNPAPPAPGISPLTTVYGNEIYNTLCGGSENIGFNATNYIPGINYIWSVTPTTFATVSNNNDTVSGISIITFNEDPGGAYTATVTVQATNSAGLGNCPSKNISLDVNVLAGNGIEEAQIVKRKGTQDLLIYADNTVNGYKWGVDSLYLNGGDTLVAKQIFLPGKYYQVYIPEGKQLLPEKVLDTLNYRFWVMVYKINGTDTCYSRVYYNGPFAKKGPVISPDNFDGPAISVFPNPSDGLFDMMISGALSGQVKIKLINTLGQTVREIQFEKTEDSQKVSFDAYNAPSGVYMIRLEGPYREKVVTKILIK